MKRHVADFDGEARRALEVRLTELQAFGAGAPEAPASSAIPTHPTPLRELVERLHREATTERAAYPDLPALADFRQLWSTLRTDSQLRQSVAHVPSDAGPLNSTALVSRAIALMRELSPDYLRSFLAYVDDLAWLEQLRGASHSTASGPAPARKRARRKP